MDFFPSVRVQIGCVHRGGPLTPYLLETIADDLRRRGRGTRLEVAVAAGTDDAGLRWVRERFARLGSTRLRVVRERSRRAAAA